MEWKWFSSKQIREAGAFADAGGIAIHENALKWHGKEAAHMFGPSAEALHKAGKELGLQPRWLQKGARIHFDLKGDPLREAKRRCKSCSAPVEV